MFLEVMMDYNDYTPPATPSERNVLRRLEVERDHLASYDPATGLPQLPFFLAQAARSASECMKRGQHLSVVAIAFDSFDMPGALYGCDGGAVLRALAQDLRHALRGEHFFTRSGRTFLALLPAMDAARATMFAERFVEKGVVLEIDGKKVVIAASAGIATSSDIPRQPEDKVRCVIDRAIAALNASIRCGWGNVTTHSPALERSLRRQGAIERAVCGAVRSGDFYFLYQPIVDVRSGRTVAVEALARWDHPELGAVTPAEFIPKIEQRGLAVEFDRLVLERSLNDFVLLRQSAPELDLHVNVSAAHFGAESVVGSLLEIVDESGVPRDRLVLEITESAAPECSDQLIRNAEETRAAGIRIAIDDLGTGFNTLRSFACLPVDIIKIDRSFLPGKSDENRHRIILSGMARTSDELGVCTVVEGVETPEDHAFALSTGAQFAQGYRYAIPLPVHHLLPLLGQAAS